MAWGNNMAVNPQNIGGMNYSGQPAMYAYNQYQQSEQPRIAIVRVNGRNGAEAYRMPPNSETLLLDTTGPIVWLIQTDGAGYKTLTPYNITPYQQETPIDVNSLEQRVMRLEEILLNAKSNSNIAKSTKRQSNVKVTSNEQSIDTAD